ncbi:MAG: hypothetical protein WCO07_00295 [bacterium]
MEKIFLRFDPDGISGQIIFPPEGRRRMFFSKIQGFDLIVECLKNKKISEEEFYDFFDRILNNDRLRCESNHSKSLCFISDDYGAQRGFIEVEGRKTSVITSAKEGNELLNVFIRCDVISWQRSQEVLKEIVEYFSIITERDPLLFNQKLVNLATKEAG